CTRCSRPSDFSSSASKVGSTAQDFLALLQTKSTWRRKELRAAYGQLSVEEKLHAEGLRIEQHFVKKFNFQQETIMSPSGAYALQAASYNTDGAMATELSIFFTNSDHGQAARKRAMQLISSSLVFAASVQPAGKGKARGRSSFPAASSSS